MSDKINPAYVASFTAAIPNLLLAMPEIEHFLHSDLPESVSQNMPLSLKEYHKAILKVGTTIESLMEEFVNKDTSNLGRFKHLQEKLSAKSHESRLNQVLDLLEEQGDISQMQTFASGRCPEAGAFLSVIKCDSKDLQMGDSIMQQALRRRFHIPEQDRVRGDHCSCLIGPKGSKRHPSSDVFGRHSTVCTSVAKQRMDMHNDVLFTLFLMAKAAQKRVLLEDTNIIKSFDPECLSRMDLVLPTGLGHVDSHVPICYDVVSVNPWDVQTTNWTTAAEPLAAAQRAVNRKNRKYGEFMHRHSIRFTALAFETEGNWHPHLKDLVHTLASEISSVTGRPAPVVESYWTKRISISINRGVSRQILKSTFLHNTSPNTNHLSSSIPNASFLSSSQPYHHDVYEAPDIVLSVAAVDDINDSSVLANFDEFSVRLDMHDADQDSFGTSPVIVDGNDIASALFMSSLNALAPNYVYTGPQGVGGGGGLGDVT